VGDAFTARFGDAFAGRGKRIGAKASSFH